MKKRTRRDLSDAEIGQIRTLNQKLGEVQAWAQAQRCLADHVLRSA